MTWLKLETSVGLQFAEGHVVLDDLKSDGLGCL